MVQRSDILPGESTRYLVMDFMGEGSFGKVAKCVDMTTNNLVAVKILNNRDDCSWEMEMLKAIGRLDPEKTNIVRFIESFRYQRFFCLAFEMLDRSLWDLLKERRAPLNLNEIRLVMQQLFVAFDALKSIDIVHADVKPDNIMLVNHRDQPFRVKLIDFGLALPVNKLYTGIAIQVQPYRAPELTMGLPLSEAVDMWSLGCVMSFLYFGGDIFDGDCDYHRLKAMVHMLGQPEDILVSAGKYTSSFFSREEGTNSPEWRLKSPEEYKQATGKEPQVNWKFFQTLGNLDYEVMKFGEKDSALEYEERLSFLSLLKSIMHMDTRVRLTPREALAHPFITKAYLAENSSYANAAPQLKAVTLSHSLDESDYPLSNTVELRDDQASDSRVGASGSHSSSHEEADPGAPKVSSDSPPTCSSDEGWNSEPVGGTATATEEDSGAAIPHNDGPTNMKENKETPAEPFQVQRCNSFPVKSTRYLVMDFVGEGRFGIVAKCVDMTTNNLVAVKMLNNRDDCSWEVKMLKAIGRLDPEKTNIVRFIESFPYQSYSCLAFEMLDRSLWDLLKERRAPLNLNEIRLVMQQLFVALDALKSIDIVHADLKPDNIMLVNHRDQPFRVKLIDFGLALPVNKLYTGITIQACSYRAPELTMGLPLSEAVDMWSLGCVMSFLYFGGDIFAGDCDYHRMKAMVHMLGQPEDILVSAGKYTSSFFSREEGTNCPEWRLKSPEEYKQATGKEPQVNWKFFQTLGNLDYEVMKFGEKDSALEYEERLSFLSLLKSIMHMDTRVRLTPREALAHPFITKAYLAENSSYANAAPQLKAVTLSHSLHESDNPLSNTVELRDDQASDSRAGASGSHSSSHEKDSERFADEPSATETSITGETHTEGYSVTNADIDTSFKQDAVLATSCIFNRHSSIASSSGKDNIMPASSVSSDSPPTHPTDKGWNSEPVGDTATATEEDSGAAIPRNDRPTNTDGDSNEGAAAAHGPTDNDNIKKKKKKNLFQRTCKLFRRVTRRVVSVFHC